MSIEPYRRLLALPGMKVLLAVGLLARIPATAAGLALTLHVVNTLNLEWVQAGLVGAVSTIGSAIGAPLAGRMVDRHGLRPVLIVTTAAQALFWTFGPALPYDLLLIAAGIAGLLALPIFSVLRQCIAAMVPVEQRRSGYALDSMTVELSYAVGPAAAVLGATTLGSETTMYLVGAGLTAAGIALHLLNPPIRSAAETAAPLATVPRRQWLRPGLLVLLGVSAALTFVLTATDLALVATLDKAGDTEWTGLVIGVWCLYSLVGGFIYGTLRRAPSPLLLISGLSGLTALLGLVGGGWWWLLIALAPAGLLCAASLSSTVDTLSQWVPASARGEAMGLHGTALTIGMAGGAPFAGWVIDHFGPSWAFAAAGSIGLLLALAAVPFYRKPPIAELAEPVEPTTELQLVTS
jgi:MFS family permease